VNLVIKIDDAHYRAGHGLVRNVKDGSVLVWVPGGEFEMGDGKDDDCPEHRVYLDGYYIGVYCVTNRQYGQFVSETGNRAPDNLRWNKESHPVVDVSWEDALAYAKWAGCELATEAQWEKAARGPLGSIYPWGDEWDEKKCRNHKNKGSEETSVVWEYGEGVSGYGTYQQSGNVWEWCRDWYDADYSNINEVERNPAGPESGSNRVNRGGSWGIDDDALFRGAFRSWYGPGPRAGRQGFRLVRSLAVASGEGGRAA
jgi:formylglycine-generating enzyme